MRIPFYVYLLALVLLVGVLLFVTGIKKRRRRAFWFYFGVWPDDPDREMVKKIVREMIEGWRKVEQQMSGQLLAEARAFRRKRERQARRYGLY